MNESIKRKSMGKRILLAAIMYSVVLISFLVIGCNETTAEKTDGINMSYKTPEEWGKFLVKVGGCNDCHTPGYMDTDGKIQESEWLIGMPVGFKGAWGTTYPANLRLTVHRMSEEAFVNMSKTRNTLPPMPWPSLHSMSDDDIRAIYKYITSLGPKGVEAPKFVGPGIEPNTPYINFTPQHLERLAHK